VSRAGNAIIDQYRQVPPQPVAVHLIVGAYETHIGPLQHGSPEANFVRGNEAMRVVLAEQGYRHAYAMYPEGHSWGLWRAYLGDALAFLFNLT
jgi:enterochelin esterase-like enzyme